MKPDNYKIPFGKHQGTKLDQLPASYLDWLVGQDWIEKFPVVTQYVKDNREHIDRELEEEEDLSS